MVGEWIGRTWLGYVLAVVVTALAALARWSLAPAFGSIGEYQLFYLSVVLAAVVGSRGSGLLAVILGALTGTGILLMQGGRPDLRMGSQAAGLVIFLGVGVAVSFLAGRRRVQHGHDEQRQSLAGPPANSSEGDLVSEPLMGWTSQEAVSRPVTSVVRTQKDALGALRRAIELYQIALDAAEMGTWEYAAESLRGTADDRCQAILGLPSHRFSYGQFLDVLHPEDRQRVDQAHWASLETTSKGRYGAEYRVVRSDGTVRWVAAKGQALFQGEGELRRAVQVVGMVTDITARKEAELALRDASELRQIAMDAAELGTWEQDPMSNLAFGDARFQAIVGVPSRHYHYQQFLDLVHPDDRLRVDQAMQVALDPASDGRGDMEYRVIRSDGSVRWVAVRGRVFFEGEGASRRAVRVIGVVQDITERKSTEEALKAGEEWLRQAVHVSGLGVFDYHYDTDTLEWSPRLREIRGFGPDEPVSIASLLERTHPDDRQRLSEAIQHSLDPSSGGVYLIESRVLWPDGTVRWTSQRGQTFFEGEGPERRPVRTVGAVVDITASKLAEEKLRASEELLQQVIRVSRLGVFDYDHHTDFIHASPRAFEILGYRPGELGNIAASLEHTHPDDRQRLAEAIQHCLDPSEDGLFAVECRVLRPDGSVRWTSQRAQTLFEGEGLDRRPARTVGAVADISERKEAEEILRTSEELFRAFFDNAAVGTSLVDLKGRFLQVNDRYCQITGYNREELLQMRPEDLFHPDDRRRDLERLALFLRGQVSMCDLEQRHVRNDGTVIWVQVNVSLIRAPDGRPLRVAGMIQDITARKEAEEALAAARQSAERAQATAEAANQAKSQFLAHMSHELRTPMNSILGMTEVALQETLSPVVGDCLQTVKDSADSLLALIDEVLDLSRIEAGALRLESKAFQLRVLLDDTLKPLALRAFEKGLELACHVAPAVPDRFRGDALRLRQILTNLLGNAIKFTEQGEVVVQVDLEAESPEEVHLRFSVSDTGIGIAKQLQQRVFEPFVQADPSTTRRFGGSGLGLSIVARLVEMLGGQVGLESQEGQGSTFFFTLALRRQGGPETPDLERLFLERLQGRAVLVADRHAVNRRILGQILSAWAIRPVPVHDVSGVFAQLQATANAGPRFPLVILDASMPGMEGLHPVERIQADARIQTPIVLTVSPAEKRRIVRLRGLPEGVAFLEKPISPLAVATALTHVFEEGAREVAPVCSPEQRPLRPLRVLLAEDTPASQKLAVYILTRRGHAVEVAQNGQEALERLNREPFDVVLMDVQMPVMDGFQATAAIRCMQPLSKARIPIIAMTAHALKGDEEQCLAVGMDAYLSKPIHGQELIALVERLADRPPASCKAPTPAPRETAEPHIDGIPQPQAAELVEFDLKDAVDKCYGQYKMFQDMVGCFFDEVDPLVEHMRTTLAQGDGEETYRAAHRLKNTVVYLGAGPAIEGAREVERLCRSGDLGAAAGALGVLEQRLARLKPALAEHCQRGQ